MPNKNDPAVVAKLVKSAFSGEVAMLTSEECAQIVALVMHSRAAVRRQNNSTMDQLQEALAPFVVKA